MTMRRSWRRIACPVPIIVLLYHLPLSAQQERHDPDLRSDCLRAAQILETSPPSSGFRRATEDIARCAETGPEVLATLWARPPVDSASLERLFIASYTLRDARITAAAIAAVSNHGSPQLVRLNALRVLVGHADPRLMVFLKDLPPELPAGGYRWLGGVSHVNVREGMWPVGRETIDAIMNVVARLGRDPDARVAAAAAYIEEQLSSRLK